ncbi:MAG: hypothetical protein PHW01_00235 [Patescibacteria group bacterium]|nr:hypothetical protein [Patescibacteria group bacterium]
MNYATKQRKENTLNFAPKYNLEKFAIKKNINLVMNVLDKMLKKLDDLIQQKKIQFSQNRRFLDRLEAQRKKNQ